MILLVAITMPIDSIAKENVSSLVNNFGSKTVAKLNAKNEDSSSEAKQDSKENSKEEQKETADKTDNKEVEKEAEKETVKEETKKDSSSENKDSASKEETSDVAPVKKTVKQTAADLKTELTNFAKNGAVKLENCSDYGGFWIMVVKDTKKIPAGYSESLFKDNVFFGADSGAVVNSAKVDSNWTKYEDGVAALFSEEDVEFLKTTLNSIKADWLAVQVYKNGSNISAKIYSGNAKADASISANASKTTLVETYIENN